MKVSKRNTITQVAARLGLLWLILMLPVWLGVTWAAAAPAMVDGQVGSPEELSSADWQSIRAAYEANRHAVQQPAQQPDFWQARNPGQQWVSIFNGRGVAISPTNH